MIRLNRGTLAASIRRKKVMRLPRKTDQLHFFYSEPEGYRLIQHWEEREK
jgi:hypothetical protein